MDAVTVKPASGPKHLLNLPEEIHNAIVSIVDRPTDRVNLCLTSKYLHRVTVRHLYKVIELELGGDKDERLPAFLSPSNIGVQYIKEIELYTEKLSDACATCNQTRQWHFTIRMLLEMLPRDQLDLMRWHPWEVFSAENMALLFRKQKCLKWVGAIGLDKPWTEDYEKKLNLDSALSQTKKLGLYPDSTDSLEFCNAILKRVKSPEKITLHCHVSSHEEDINYIPNINDTPTEAGALARTVFRHMLPFNTCTPLQLTSVTLEGINLRYCLNSFCKVIDFTKVQKLSICHSKSSDALLAALCNSSRLPTRLERFEFKNDDDHDECEVMDALNTFLCLVTGIQSLTLDVCATKHMPMATAIVRHAKTLELLNAHSWKQGQHDGGPAIEQTWTIADFEKITKACKRIEQLSVGFPTSYIGKRSTDLEDHEPFSLCLGNLPRLVTFNLTTWPQHRPATTSQRLPRKMYEDLLCAEAQEGFALSTTHAKKKSAETEIPPDPNEPRWTNSKLRVISFGISDRIFDRIDSQTIWVFVKGESVDPLGGPKKVCALKMDMCLKHFFEPRTDILDMSLSHQPPPPIREIDPDDWD